MNSIDILFIIVSSSLVFFMTPGLAMFYGGLVRHKNILSVIMQNFLCMGIVPVVWIIIGYSLAFGPDVSGFIGNLDYFLLNNISLDTANTASNIPEFLFLIFQLMFAILTVALITGAIAERMKFSSFFIFSILWILFVYLPVCHWVWGGGWLQSIGALDFAGGTVVHINAGISSLVCVFFLGRRRGWRREFFSPNNLPITLLGAGILWFGWFGFNAGSALGVNAVAVVAFLNTQIAAGAAGVSWICAEWVYRGKPTTLGIASGFIAGLVAITPAAGFVGPMASLLIGLISGVLCYSAIFLKFKLKYDDALDVVGIHGVGGIIGAFATGLFASKRWNPSGENGLFYGNVDQIFIQLAGIISVLIYASIITAIIMLIIKFTIGLRVDSEAEENGLDISEHSEDAYKIEI
ncbi:MAG: ammonium transporter [Deferribacterota bacterium]|nr:ammonium transporter [Deferribacterota bacterium]